MIRFARLALTFSLCTISVQFLAAQKPTPLKNFDIRESLTAGTQASSLTESSRRSASEQGSAVREKLLSTRGTEGEDLRFSLNRFGLPKLVSARRGALTEPSIGDRARIARDYLLANPIVFPLLPREIEEFDTAARHEARGLETLRLKQRIGAIPVYGGDITIAFDSLGRIVQIGAGDVVTGVDGEMTPQVSAESAVLSAARSLGANADAQTGPAPSPSRGWFGLINPFGGGDVAVQLVAFPMSLRTARPAWRILIGSPQGDHEVLIAADSEELLIRNSLVAHMGQALVWPQSPVQGERETKTFGDGWLPDGGTLSVGNNVDAFLDVFDDGEPDDVNEGGLSGGRASAADQNFTFASGDGFGSPADFRASSITHLFYHVNSAHDFFYDLGFTEAAGNFQDDNFALGGMGGDAVDAKAQVLDSINNASMLTRPDGIRPIMRSGVFVTPNDFRDSALEGDVIIHEYAHGVSNRLVGGADMVGCLGGPVAGAMGEGWSDYFALSFFDDTISGAYLTGNPERGVRRFPYDGYPFTYEDLGNEGFQVHNDGEIWAATLLDIRAALGAETTDALVLDGLRLTPCGPTFIDARDAILGADDATNGSANARVLWEAFANRGLGEQARGFDEFGSLIFDANFDLPPEFQDGNRPPLLQNGLPLPPQLGEQVVYTIFAADPDGDALTYEILEGPPGATVDAEGPGALDRRVYSVSTFRRDYRRQRRPHGPRPLSA